jgi:hypothetical protein
VEHIDMTDEQKVSQQERYSEPWLVETYDWGHSPAEWGYDLHDVMQPGSEGHHCVDQARRADLFLLSMARAEDGLEGPALWPPHDESWEAVKDVMIQRYCYWRKQVMSLAHNSFDGNYYYAGEPADEKAKRFPKAPKHVDREQHVPKAAA